MSPCLEESSGAHDTAATIHFVDPDTAPAPNESLLGFSFRPNLFPDNGFTQNYMTYARPDIPIRDARPRKETLSLDKEGFCVLDSNVHMPYEDHFDHDKLHETLAPLLREELRVLLGAKLVFFNECRIRKVQTSQTDTIDWSKPNLVAHIDNTRDDVIKNISILASDNVGKILTRRYQALNLWKPLRGPLRDNCLALCDATTLNLKKDAREGMTITPEGVQQHYRVLHGEQQQWYYLHDQLPSEYWVFKSYDSEANNPVAHAAFTHPGYPNEPIPRESIEIRAIVVY